MRKEETVKTSNYKGVFWDNTRNGWMGTLYYKGHDLRFYGDTDYDVHVKRKAAKDRLKPLPVITNKKGEIWKDIVLGGSNYSISNKGRVKTYNYRNTGDCRILEPSINRYGYEIMHIGRREYKVHTLVASCFLKNKNQTVNHKDGNKRNNCVENLEWLSIRANKYHYLIVLEKREYVGIKWSKVNRRWIASIEIDGRNIRLGAYSSPKEAHDRFRSALIEYGLIEDYNYLVRIMSERGY